MSRRGDLQIDTTANHCDTTFDLVCRQCNTQIAHAPPKSLPGGYCETTLQEIYSCIVSGIGMAGCNHRQLCYGRNTLTTGSFNCTYLYKIKQKLEFFDKETIRQKNICKKPQKKIQVKESKSNDYMK